MLREEARSQVIQFENESESSNSTAPAVGLRFFIPDQTFPISVKMYRVCHSPGIL